MTTADHGFSFLVAGTFFLCDANDPEFGSLSEELLNKYLEMFRYPENFVRVNGEITAVKFNPCKEG